MIEERGKREGTDGMGRDELFAPAPLNIALDPSALMICLKASRLLAY